jgi:hypothetical protein
VKGGAPGVTPHMFRHVPPLAVLRVRRPLTRDRPWPDRPFPPPFFVGRLVGRLFIRGIIQIYQSSAEEDFSLGRANNHTRSTPGASCRFYKTRVSLGASLSPPQIVYFITYLFDSVVFRCCRIVAVSPPIL